MSVNLEALTRPFPREAIRQRKGGGGVMLDYVEGHTVIRRLNEATGNRWNLSVLDISERQLGGQTLITARVALTIPDLGSREALGVQLVSERGGEDLVKGAVTDALKKAATLFGVGLELYGPDYEASQRPKTTDTTDDLVGLLVRLRSVGYPEDTLGFKALGLLTPKQARLLIARYEDDGGTWDGLKAQLAAQQEGR